MNRAWYMAMSTPNKQSETAMLEMVKILRRLLRNVFLKASGKNLNGNSLFCRVP